MIRRLAGGVAALLLLTGCGTAAGEDPEAAPGTPSVTTASTAPTPTASAHGHADTRPAAGTRRPLRQGERRVTVRMPEPYTPAAPTGKGTDDYRCFLLDPGVSADSFITGFNVLPGNPDVVHHVILFRVPPALVGEAEQKDAATPGEGWTCFGNSGIGNALQIDDAPWLGAWAPGGREQVTARGYGTPLAKGSRVVMQVHYNLLRGSSPDTSATELRLARADRAIRPLRTRLLPAPVELPCRPRHADGPLCDRDAALADVKERFGQGPGGTADALHFLCGPIRPGPEQSCTRTVMQRETVRGVAGHMHLLGRSIKVEVNPGKPDARTLLDIPEWDFDNQATRPIRPVTLEPLDRIRVTCRHTQALRDRLPAFAGQPDRYVLWGEGSTDEMCLGILQVTRP